MFDLFEDLSHLLKRATPIGGSPAERAFSEHEPIKQILLRAAGEAQSRGRNDLRDQLFRACCYSLAALYVEHGAPPPPPIGPVTLTVRHYMEKLSLKMVPA